MIRRIKFIAGLFKIHRKSLLAESADVEKETREPMTAALTVPQVISMLAVKPHRKPKPDEPLAFCADCYDWTPMKWLPAKERGRKAETWFQCEYCGNRRLTLRYLSFG